MNDVELEFYLRLSPKVIQTIILDYYKSIYDNVFWIQDEHFKIYKFFSNKNKKKRLKIKYEYLL